MTSLPRHSPTNDVAAPVIDWTNIQTEADIARTVDVDRVFIKDGEEVKRERITTRYKATPEVVCGPKKKKDKGKLKKENKKEVK